MPAAARRDGFVDLPLAQGQQELCVHQSMLLGAQEGLLIAAAGCMLGRQLSQLVLQAGTEQVRWQGLTSGVPGSCGS